MAPSKKNLQVGANAGDTKEVSIFSRIIPRAANPAH